MDAAAAGEARGERRSAGGGGGGRRAGRRHGRESRATEAMADRALGGMLAPSVRRVPVSPQAGSDGPRLAGRV